MTNKKSAENLDDSELDRVQGGIFDPNYDKYIAGTKKADATSYSSFGAEWPIEPEYIESGSVDFGKGLDLERVTGKAHFDRIPLSSSKT